MQDDSGRPHPNYPDMLAALETIARLAEEYGIETDGASYSFIQLLCRDTGFFRSFIDYVLQDHPHSRLGFQICVCLRQLRDSDLDEYQRIGLACAVHDDARVAWGAANAVCIGPQRGSPVRQDLVIIAKLARHSDPSVRRLAIYGAGAMAHESAFTKDAIQIIAEVDIAGSARIADEICDAFGQRGLSVTELTRRQIDEILRQFVEIDRLRDHEYEVFLSKIGEYAPDLLFRYLLKRLRRFSELPGRRGFRYLVWRDESPRHYFRKASVPAGAADQLREARDTLLCDDVPTSYVASLFWVFGNAAGAAEQALQEWLSSGEPKKMQRAEYLADVRRSFVDDST